jgi:hypothetical protein
VAPEEVDELAFLFGPQAGPDWDSLGWVLRIDLDGLGVLGSLEGAGHGGMAWPDEEGGALRHNSFSLATVTVAVANSMLLCS